jgi:hypothetical protein
VRLDAIPSTRCFSVPGCTTDITLATFGWSGGTSASSEAFMWLSTFRSSVLLIV